MEIEGLDSVEALHAVKQGSALALSISTISVYLFLGCRMILAIGESGNFPSAIKVTALHHHRCARLHLGVFLVGMVRETRKVQACQCG